MATTKKANRQRRARRTRVRISLLGVHRLCVHRTPQHIYAQIIAPEGNRVVASASTLNKELRGSLKGTGNIAAAAAVVTAALHALTHTTISVKDEKRLHLALQAS